MTSLSFRAIALIVLFSGTLLTPVALLAQESAGGGEVHIDKDAFPTKKAEYSPYVDQHFPQRLNPPDGMPVKSSSDIVGVARHPPARAIALMLQLQPYG